MSALITEEELMKQLGYERRGDLVRWLREAGIKYRPAKGGKIVTVQAAIDAAFVRPGVEYSGEQRFEL